MGREIKRVPVDFDWPLDTVWKGYVPGDDVAVWDETKEEYITSAGEIWEPYDPPTGTGWQVWETVSEGSPITPVFPASLLLIDHLAEFGTTWDRKPRGLARVAPGPWRREAAEAFVREGWAPSFVAIGGQPTLFDGARDADLIATASRATTQTSETGDSEHD